MPDIRNLTSDMARIIARWEIMIDNKVISPSFSYLTDEIYQNLTKYLSPMEVSNLIQQHTKNIGGYKNAQATRY